MPLLIGAVAAVPMLVAVFISVLFAVLPSSQPSEQPCQPPAPTAVPGIPDPYLALYVKAGQQYGVGWQVLAAVGDVESDHGRGTGPGIRSGTNHAGAAGPMQFLPGTWAAFGVDGDHDGDKNVYDPADAIPGAARYLKHEGAPHKIRTALFRYNHSDTYVEAVLRQARTYAPASRTSPAAPPQAEVGQACEKATTGVGRAPDRAAAIAVKFARNQIGKPYAWGAEGPASFDCSGLTYAAYRAAGITIPRVSGDQWRQESQVRRGHERPGDLVFFNSGPGTSATSPGHVGLVIAKGKMVAAPRTGSLVQIQSYNRQTLLGFARPKRTR